MPKPRYAQISVSDTAFYHCVSRCVRQSYLCGTDELTGQSYEHRRAWVEQRIQLLGAIFSIDICAYAVMSNHYHIVLHINRTQAENWSLDDIIERWHRLYQGNLISKRYCRGEVLNCAEMAQLKAITKCWRERLTNISWFMRSLNEPIARQANLEDECTGRFWEGRFKSQALLDEGALLACMAYVDLNPIRAQVASTPETSAHTSIQLRIKHTDLSLQKLYPFVGGNRENRPEGIPFKLSDYIELIDWSGRILREDKRGYIENSQPPILARLAQDTENWLELTQHFEDEFKLFAGSVDRVTQVCQVLGYQRRPGIQACAKYFS